MVLISLNLIKTFLIQPDEQKLVALNGKHTPLVEQHELTTHTEVFDVHSFVILSHGSKSEH